MESISSAADLGSDQFLTLFVTQLENQNPLEPMENSEFLAQLAQFSSLEQLGKQTDLMTDQLKNSTLTQALQELEIASSLVGKDIMYTDSDGNKVTGTVKGVLLKDNGVYFDVGNNVIPISGLEGIM